MYRSFSRATGAAAASTVALLPLLRSPGKRAQCESSVATGAQQRRAFGLDSAARCISGKDPRVVDAPLRQDCGEDAFFLARSSVKDVRLGIADGVGGWRKYGVDPALFAWELMSNCQDSAECGKVDGAQGVLEDGYKRLVGNEKAPEGSCTACVASLERSGGQLKIANLGDSGAILVRKGGCCVLETEEQLHSFNNPYALTLNPDSALDKPESSVVYTAQVEEGDVLLMATDGFFDNVWTEKAFMLLEDMSEAEPTDIAEALLKLSHKNSRSKLPTPFSKEALRNGQMHRGGKRDDITIIVARVIREE